MDQPNFYAVIPANVRYDKRLKANEKLLYGEITSLANAKGYCYASNNYFAELYDVKERAVQKWILNLKNNGYIRVEISENNTKRKIFIADISQNINLEPPNKKTPTPEQKDTPTPEQKDTHNNTSINNINNIFDFWNSKEIIRHKKITSDFEKVINTAIKKFGYENIMIAIDRYSKAYFDPNYFYKHKWNLLNFLKQSNGLSNWLDDGQMWNNYLPNKVCKPSASPPSAVPGAEETNTYLQEIQRLREGGGMNGKG